MRLIHLSLVVCLVAVSIVAVAQEPIPVSDVRQNDPNGAPVMLDQIVTVQGVVTVPTGVFNTSRTDVYIQDDTGGIMFYNPQPVMTYNAGDEVKVTGTVSAYNGMTQIEPITAELIGVGRPEPEPVLLTCAELRDSYDFGTNIEPNEGRLIRLNGVTWDGGNYALMDDTGTAMMYIDPDTGIPWPDGEFNVLGVMKQYDDAGDEGPWYLGYEVLPRYISDITFGSGPQFLTYPIQTDVAMGGATISWTTDAECETWLEYGTTTNFEMDPVELGNSTLNHEVVLTGLSSATVYYVRAVATDGTDSIASPAITIVSPSEQSSGQIDVFFSQSVDTTYSTGVDAVQTNLANRMVDRINAATSSIDFCFFSFTHDDVGDALVEAHNRGVDVRVIYEIFDPVINVLTVAGIEVRTDPDDEHENMHNKFAVFDAGDGVETNDYVWTGSWNASYNGTENNAENALTIQDAALAAAYTIEFEEMWDGNFSYFTEDNTPHRFLIGGRKVEQYMSPQDGMPDPIVALMDSADTDMFFSIYSYTHDVVFNAMTDRFDAGVAVRGVCDADASEYGRYQDLADHGVDVVLDNVEQGGLDQLLHHKYLMADPLSADSDPTVVTGSYNWTFTAATYKNENVLIIHDATIVNLFFQEWMARYKEAGGTWDAEMPGMETPIYIAAAAAYPNNTPPWASDLGITNNSDEELTYKMQFLPRGADNTDVAFTEDMTLAANSSVSYVDVWNTFAGEGSGAINVTVSNANVASVTSRIYTTTDEGTLGQSFVGKRGTAPAKIDSGDVARLGFLAQNSEFRTNVGFMNAGAASITVNAEFFDVEGASLGTSSIDLPPYSNNQWNKAFITQVGANDVDSGAFIDVWSDSADASFLAYASVIDNASDDPTTIWPFDNAEMVGGGGLDCTPIWIAAAASYPDNTPPWASDVGITNLGAEELSFKFQFLPRGQDNSSVDFSESFTLGGNQAIAYSDIWNDLAGGQGAGAINVCVDNGDNAGVVSRIYSTGDNGTYGQSFDGMRGGAPAKVVTGEKVRLTYLFQNDAYRTNVGFMNAGANTVFVQGEFFDSEGNSLGIKGVNLKPYSNFQWNKAFTLDPIFAADIEAGYVDVWTDTPAADFLTYASVVDNGTDDPTTIWPF
ncbi:MAG: phospholipase D-like domain-containing protein [Acidobacteriota bacterium]